MAMLGLVWFISNFNHRLNNVCMNGKHTPVPIADRTAQDGWNTSWGVFLNRSCNNWHWIFTSVPVYTASW